MKNTKAIKEELYPNLEKNQYHILFNCGSEGWHFHDKFFSSEYEAIKVAVGLNRCMQFVIVTVNWKPQR